MVITPNRTNRKVPSLKLNICSFPYNIYSVLVVVPLKLPIGLLVRIKTKLRIAKGQFLKSVDNSMST